MERLARLFAKISRKKVMLMENESDLFERIGRMLFNLQRIERFVMACLLLAHDRPGSEVRLQKILERDKETLGGLLKQFREVLTLPNEFEKRLEELLAFRNQFVHRLCFEDWMDLTSAAGRKRLSDYLSDLRDTTAFVARILLAYVFIKSREERQLTPEVTDFLEQLTTSIAKTCTVSFQELPENYFDLLAKEVRTEFAPKLMVKSVDAAQGPTISDSVK